MEQIVDSHAIDFQQTILDIMMGRLHPHDAMPQFIRAQKAGRYVLSQADLTGEFCAGSLSFDHAQDGRYSATVLADTHDGLREIVLQMVDDETPHFSIISLAVWHNSAAK